MAQPPSRKRATPAPPITPARLDELALGYVARYATSGGKLAAYLARKLGQRGWAGEGDPPVAAIVARMKALGYLDDRAFATARGAALGARGMGARRVREALRAAGIGEDDVAEADAAARDGALAHALVFARRRRIGPFAAAAADRDGRRRALAAMLRAGHPPDIARRVVEALPGTNLDEE